MCVVCAQVERLTSGDSAPIALLWDIVELLRLDAEPKSASVEAAPGAIVVASPSGDAAGMAGGETDGDGNADVEPDAAVAAGTGTPQENSAAEPAVYSRLAQVSSRSLSRQFAVLS